MRSAEEVAPEVCGPNRASGLDPSSRALVISLSDATDVEAVGVLAVSLGAAERAGVAMAAAMVLTVEAVRRIRTTGLTPARYRIPGQRDRYGLDPVNTALAEAWHQAGRGGLAQVVLRPSGPEARGLDASVEAERRADTWAAFRQTVIEMATSDRAHAIIVERNAGSTVSGTLHPPSRPAHRWTLAVDGGNTPVVLPRRPWPLGSTPPGLDSSASRQLRRIGRKVNRPFRWAIDPTGRAQLVSL